MTILKIKNYILDGNHIFAMTMDFLNRSKICTGFHRLFIYVWVLDFQSTNREGRVPINRIHPAILKLLGTMTIVMMSTPKCLEKFEL